MKRAAILLLIIPILLGATSLSGCSQGGADKKFVILSGSENETLAPILDQFGADNRVNIKMVYKGSVDIMNMLGTDEIKQYDAVWPANSIWINMGDANHVIKNAVSIMNSPIAFGIKKPLAERLGFTDGDVTVADILKAIREEKFTFMMTSATQSNSGACAYIGFLHAMLGGKDPITLEDLNGESLKKDLKDLLGGINRSSGSSGWLKKLFLQGDYDAMVNYESMLIEANQELVKAGRDPLYLVYPKDGLAMADSPLGMVNRGDSEAEQVFHKLQEYLLSKPVQQKILALGRRTGFGGSMENADPAVFNPDWGIDPGKTLSGIRMPDSDVLLAALELYQSELKKPAYTVYCLDFSGSMEGDGERSLKQAMRMILDQDQSRRFLLQATPGDVSVVIPFHNVPMDEWTVEGNDLASLTRLADQIDAASPGGGTDIYSPAIRALERFSTVNESDYFCAIVLLTDGKSNEGASYHDFEAAYQRLGKDIPLFAIMLGDASSDQLSPMTALTRGDVFDSKGDLVSAFKKVKGYN